MRAVFMLRVAEKVPDPPSARAGMAVLTTSPMAINPADASVRMVADLCAFKRIIVVLLRKARALGCPRLFTRHEVAAWRVKFSVGRNRKNKCVNSVNSL